MLAPGRFATLDGMSTHYDAIVVGARCAGSPTAMLLARKGYRVLVVDRATFPSDTLSTHLIHAPGVAALGRWGLLPSLVATGCPGIDAYAFDFGPFVLRGSPPAIDGQGTAYGPRRTILDKLLVDAAAAAGAEVREGFTVDGLVVEDGVVTGVRGRGREGTSVVERASIVIGADGRHSRVAGWAGAEAYDEHPTLEAGYYAYWSGLPTTGFEVFVRPHRSFGTIATHDGQTLVVVTWPIAEFEANRADLEGAWWRTVETAPAFAERLRAARRESRILGTGDLPNYFRTPFGPGWALVGDAGYHKDPQTAQGITDAFLDAERLARAVGRWLGDGVPFGEAMGDAQRARDAAVRPMYQLTLDLASLEPPPPELAQLLAAMPGNQEAMDGFAGVIAGTVPVPAFFAEDNVRRILGEAAVPATAI